MEKIIKIDGKDIKLKATGAFALKYKAQFGRDAIQDIMKMSMAFNGDGISDADMFDSEVLYNLVWSLAKNADDTIPPVMEWLDSFEEFPLVEVMPDVIDLITISFASKKARKK